MWNQRRSPRRSDEIRKRWLGQSQPASVAVEKRKPKPARHVVPRTLPPVMARYPMTGNPQPEGRRLKKVRRRYDVALNAQGTEIRLPALPQVRLGWRLISFALAVGLAFVLYHFVNSPIYKVEAVQVEGLQRLTKGDVNAVLGVIGKQVFTLNPAGLDLELEKAFPEFSAVSVQVALPNQVLVKLTERIPALLWRQDEHIDLVDVEGKAFPLRNEAMASGLLVVEASGSPPALLAPIPSPTPQSAPTESSQLTGAFLGLSSPARARQFLTPGMIKAILLLAGQAPQGVPIIYSPQHGLGWRDGRGWDAYFGDIQDMEMKLLVYQAILQRLDAEDLFPTLVSVEYVHAPYFRVER